MLAQYLETHAPTQATQAPPPAAASPPVVAKSGKAKRGAQAKTAQAKTGLDQVDILVVNKCRERTERIIDKCPRR